MTWLPWKVALVLAIALYSTALKDAEFIETGDCEVTTVLYPQLHHPLINFHCGLK